MRDSVLMYRSLYEAIKHLPPEGYKEVLDAIFEYALNDVQPEPVGVAYAMFMMAKPQIDANSRKYNNRVSKNKAEQIGTNENKQEQAGTSENKAEQTAVINDKCKMINDIKKENIKEKRFVPPSVDEVREYITEKGLKVNAESFVDFYASKGWLVGKNKMKDWRAAVRNWDRSQREELTAKAQRQESTAKVQKNRFHNFEERKYDFDALEKKLLAGGAR